MRVIALALLVAAPVLAQPEGDCCDEPTPCDQPVLILPAAQPPPPPPKISEDRFLLKLSLGGAYQRIFGESLGGGSLELALGAEDSKFAGEGDIGFTAGRTLGGLTYVWFRFGPTFMWRVGERVRLGFGTSVGTLDVLRATGGDMWSPTVGLHFDLSVDLARGHGGKTGNALFASLRLGGDVVIDVESLSNTSLLVSAGLGYRF